MSATGKAYIKADQAERKAAKHLDTIVNIMVAKGYNVSAVSRELGVGRNVVYRSLERTHNP